MEKSTFYYKEMLRISIPILLSSFTSTLLGVAAIPILGHHSVSAMAISSIATSGSMIFISMLLISFTGYRILCSKELGREDLKQANIIFNNNAIFSLFLSFLFMLITFFIPENIINLLIKENHHEQYLVKSYLKISAISYPFIAVINLIFTAFSLQKKTIYVFYISIIMNLTGVVLSCFFVYGKFGIKPFGVLGIAWAMLVENIIGFALAICFYIKKDKTFTIDIRTFSIIQLKKIFYISAPAIISTLLDYFANFIIYSQMWQYFGEEILSAGRICYTIILLYFTTIISLNSGFMVMGGRSLGRNNIKEFLSYFKYSKRLLFYSSIITATILLISLNQLLLQITSFEHIRKIVFYPLVIVAISMPIISCAYHSASSLRLIEKIKIDMLCNIFSIWIVQIPLTFLLSVYFDLDLLGVSLAFLIYQFCYGILNNYFFKKFCKISIQDLR